MVITNTDNSRCQPFMPETFVLKPQRPSLKLTGARTEWALLFFLRIPPLAILISPSCCSFVKSTCHSWIMIPVCKDCEKRFLYIPQKSCEWSMWEHHRSSFHWQFNKHTFFFMNDCMIAYVLCEFKVIHDITKWFSKVAKYMWSRIVWICVFLLLFFLQLSRLFANWSS